MQILLVRTYAYLKFLRSTHKKQTQGDGTNLVTVRLFCIETIIPYDQSYLEKTSRRRVKALFWSPPIQFRMSTEIGWFYPFLKRWPHTTCTNKVQCSMWILVAKKWFLRGDVISVHLLGVFFKFHIIHFGSCFSKQTSVKKGKC